MSATLLLTDPLFLRHDPGAGHPESPARLESILEQLERAPLAGLERKRPRPATPEELAFAHRKEFLTRLEGLRGLETQLDPDTATSVDSVDAAVLAAGAGAQAVEEVMAGSARNAFALVRPPGHHAEPNRAMGFCLLNNAAVAAGAALARGAQRVLVLDWDVHHGNGTQECFWGRRDVLYQSAHQFPFYPGTGAPYEVGVGPGMGFTVNCGLPAGCGDADYGALFHDLFLPVGQAFRPDVIIVSAGFDSHEDDPLGGMQVTERGFAAMCTAVRALAEETCGGRLVLLLEGGYSLVGLPRSVHACLEVLMGARHPFPDGATRRATGALAESRASLRAYWPVLG
jgi:acetoin utilization deacetylase AcuC-like enzyme